MVLHPPTHKERHQTWGASGFDPRPLDEIGHYGLARKVADLLFLAAVESARAVSRAFASG